MPVHVYGVSGRHAEHNMVSDLRELQIPMEGKRKAGKKTKAQQYRQVLKKKLYRHKDSNSQKREGWGEGEVLGRRDGGSRL